MVRQLPNTEISLLQMAAKALLYLFIFFVPVVRAREDAATFAPEVGGKWAWNGDVGIGMCLRRGLGSPWRV